MRGSVGNRRRGARRLGGATVVAALLASTLALVTSAPVAHAAVLVVTTAADEQSANGACSLREAILNANSDGAASPDCVAGAGADVIGFAIPGAGPHQILLDPGTLGGLPSIVGTVQIDGTTQPGWSAGALAIEITTQVPNQSLLTMLGTTWSSVRGLILNGTTGSGAAILAGQGTTIAGNWIGTDRSGAAAGGNAIGVYIAGVADVIVGGTGVNDGNVISGNGTGVMISGFPTPGADSNALIAGNRIGTNSAGTAAVPNGIGIHLNVDAPGVAVDGNVISGNSTSGIELTGERTRGTSVTGNVIGLDAAQSAAIPNGIGIRSSGGEVALTDIGDGSAAGANVISGNVAEGIRFGDDTIATSIRGNFIGTADDGTTPFGNGGAGISLNTYTGFTTIGGLAPGEANVIAFNATGVRMAVDAGALFSVVGNRVVGNRTFGNIGRGIDLVGADVNDPGDADQGANRLQNFPVVSATIQGGQLVAAWSIDSTTTASRYPISVHFYEADSQASGEGQRYLASSSIAGPGTNSADPLGAAATLGIAGGDLIVATATDADGNTSNFSVPAEVVAVPAGSLVVTSVGDGADPSPADGVCETATGNGICTLRAAIQTTNAAPGPDTIVFGIGGGAGVRTIQPQTPLPDVTGDLTIDASTEPGANCGVWPPVLKVVLDAAGVPSPSAALAVFGGSLALRGLVINRYSNDGVFVDPRTNTTPSTFQCNFIGTDATGRNALGQGVSGIFLNGAGGHTIGGPLPGQANVIAGVNAAEHLRIAASDDNVVQGNFIGTDVLGQPLAGFASRAILLTGGGNLIGGPGAGEGNVIAGSAGTGIDVRSTGATGNTIRGNRIFDNALLGIDLFDPTDPRLGTPGAYVGITYNHAPGSPLPDPAPNNFQNHPVLTVAASVAGSTRVVGTLESTPNRAFAIDVYQNSSCDPSGFGEGSVVVGAFDVTTDGAGVAAFDQTLPVGLGEPHGVTATATDLTTGDTSEFSYCRPSSTPNLTWHTAQAVTSGQTVQQRITDNLQEKWFRIAVNPGDTVNVELTGAPGSAVSLHRDPLPVYHRLTNPSSAAVLSAEAADVAFLPSGSLPSGSLPSGSLPSGSLPSGSLPSGSLERGFLPSGSLPSGSLPSGSLPSGSLPSGSLPSGSLDAYSSAARRSLMGISMDPYARVQTIERHTFDLQEDLYIRVVGPYDLAAPFTLRVALSGGACSSLDPVPAGLPVVATGQLPDADRSTVIVTDSSRLGGTAAEIQAALADLQLLAGRPDVRGVVVDLADRSAFPRVAFANGQADAHPECPAAKNLVAEEIKAVVDAHRAANRNGTSSATTLEYVVLGGGADVIPFHQVQDIAGLASEKEYVPPVQPNSASEAGLRSGLVKGQDFYGSAVELTIGSRTVAVPGLAVGRLVDDAADISAAVDAYVATNGTVRPGSALVTGYDFVGDGAAAVQEQLAAATLQPDTLIQPPGRGATSPDAWSADQLRAKLLAARPGGVTVLTGHFSAGSLIAADYRTTLTAAEIAASPADFTGSVVLALGCHGGFAVPSTDLLEGASPDPDWAKAFVRKGAAAYVAATGYAYGDTELTEYGERLFVDLTQQMRTGLGPIPMGKALVAAKREYLASTAQMTGIDEKTLVEMTLYGLPMMKVDLPGPRLTPPADGTVVAGTAPVPNGPGVAIGLTQTLLDVTPSTSRNEVPLTNLDTAAPVPTVYYAGRDGVVANPYEPILPKQIDDVTVDGRVLRGVALRGGTYEDVQGVIPLTAAPATETSRPHVSFLSDVFYPNQVWVPNFYDAVDAAGGGRTRLVTVPAQYRSDAPGSVSGTVRRFTDLDLALYYMPAGWTADGSPGAAKAAAVSPGPSITGVSASVTGSIVTFRVNAQTDGSAGVQAVWVLYTADAGPFHGRWAPVDLSPVPDDPTLWTGTLDLGGTAAGGLRFMVQGVNGAGLTALSTNLGEYYPVASSATPPPPPAPASITLEGPASGAYQTPRTFSAQLTDQRSGGPLAGRTVRFDIGGQQASAVTDGAGRASVTITPVVPPGAHRVQVSSKPTASHQIASASQAFTITKASTSLVLQVPDRPIASGTPTGVSAELTTASGRGVVGRSVAFVLTGPSAQVVHVVATDNTGVAVLPPITAPAGTYSVRAHFGGGAVDGVTPPLVLPDDEHFGTSATGATSVAVTDSPVLAITVSLTNADGTTYVPGTWTDQAVSVDFTCTPGRLPVASCEPDRTITADGTTPATTGVVRDTGGGTATVQVGAIQVDRTAPVVSLTTPVDGASYPQGAVVVADFTCTDATSGIQSCAGTVDDGQPIDTTTVGTRTFVVDAADVAGGTTRTSVAYTVTPVVVPNQAPVVRADMDVAGLQEVGFQSNAVVLTGTFHDADGTGPFEASVRWTATGPFTPFTLDGSSSFTASRNYPSAGTRVVTVRVCDRAGACGTDDVTVRTSVTQRITPVRECVVDRGSAVQPRYEARFGYDNPAPFAIHVATVPVRENTFTNAPHQRGQPQIFLPGSRRNVFTTTFPRGAMSWRLNRTTVTANAASPRC